MSLAKALFYFLQEACQSLVRSWKISVVAILTMSVSLFLCGLFLLALQNLSATLENWRQSLRVIVYVRGETQEDEYLALERALGQPTWIRSVVRVSAEEAAQRFRDAFPGLADLTRDWEEPPFPASLEATLDSSRLEDSAFDDWLEHLRSQPATLMVDADQDWLNQLSTLFSLLTGAALTLGVIFLVAAALTGASILRLIAHLHREEIVIMRLVGATEFYVRGPFYVEGLIQGLSGATLALGALGLIVAWVKGGQVQPLWSGLLFSGFLSTEGVVLVLLAGGLTGVVGAFVSLRREGAELDLS